MKSLFSIALVLLLNNPCGAAAHAEDVRISTVSSLQKLTAGAPGELEPFSAQPIRLRAARGEWECFQVVVTAGDKPLTNLKLTGIGFDDMGWVTANSMPKLEAWWENYVYIDKPSGNRRIDKIWWPDALIPARQGAEAVPRTVEANKSVVLWVAVRAPYSQAFAAASHNGKVTFSSDEVPELQAAFSLTVEPVILPQPSLRANAALYYDVLRDWYTKTGRTFTDAEWAAQKKRYYDFLLDYGINAYDLPVGWDSDEADKYLKDPRVLSVRVPPLDSPDLPTALARLKKDKALGKAYFYWIDEPAPERYNEVRETTKKLHAIEPKLKHLITLFPGDALKDAADIWCPNIGDAFGLGHLDMARMAHERKAGRETWWYTMVVPRAPYPTWLVDDDASSVRLYGWMMAKWNITGFVYSMVHGWGPKPLENIQSFAGTNGDGTLVYPAEEVGGVGPMPSIRLMLLRDSIEDYELLQLLSPKTRDGLVARVVGATPAQRIDSEDGWRRGLYRDLLFDYLGLRNLKARPSGPKTKAPIIEALAGKETLRSARFLQPFVFRRFAVENVTSSPRVWMGHDGKLLLVSAELDRLQAEGGEWFAVELAPVNAQQRWRFVLTAKGKGVVEKHIRDGRFLVEGIAWKYSLRPVAGSSKVNLDLKIPLAVLGEKGEELRFNALYRQYDDEAKIQLLRRAFADDGDVTRMVVARMVGMQDVAMKGK